MAAAGPGGAAPLSLSEAAATGVPETPGLDLPPGDRVVSAMDVVVCSATQALGGRVVLLQQPLRGTWRPYDLSTAAAARMRPKARRLELELPLETGGPNYNRRFAEDRRAEARARKAGGRSRKAAEDDEGEHSGAEDGEGGSGSGLSKPMEKLLLRSQATEANGASGSGANGTGGASSSSSSGAGMAIGVVRGGRLLLVPVDYSLQLRPHLPHLSVPSEKAAGGGGGRGGGRGGGGGESEGGEDEADESAAVEIEVTVKRRETERQQAARLKSFSHLQAEEESEDWKKLGVANADSRMFWASVAPAPTAAAAAANGEGSSGRGTLEPPPALPRAAYLEAITPGAAGPPAGITVAPRLTGPSGSKPKPPPAGAAGAAAAAGAVATAAAGQQPPPPGALSADAAAAVRRALRELFRHHAVVNLEDIRAHLRDLGEPTSTARQGATLGDDALHAAVIGGGEFAALRRAYAARPGPKDPAAELRGVVLELLAERSQLRKGDVVAAAKTKGAAFVEAHYNKVMRELCKNNGGVWTVRAGKDD